MRLLTNFFTKKNLIVIFFLTSFVVFSQRGQEYTKNIKKINFFFLVIFLFGNLSNSICFAQEKYLVKVVDGPNFASDLFYSSQQRIVSQVPHLKNLEVTFGLANWYLTTNPSVAAATSSITVELPSVNYTGFVMRMPNGSDKRVSLSEAGITPSGFNIVDIKLNFEFGKIGVRASTEIDFYGSFNKPSKGSSFIRFNTSEDSNKFSKFVYDNKLKSTQDIFSALNPQVTFSHKGSYNGSILSEYTTFFLRKINSYIQKIWLDKEQEKINEQVKFLVQDADRQNMVGNHISAKQKYQEAYKLRPTKELLAQITKTNDLINKKTNDEITQVKLNEANNYLNNKDYDAALSKFNEVYALKPSEDIKRQITAVENIIKEKKNANTTVTDSNNTKKINKTSDTRINTSKKTNTSYSKPKTTYNPKLTTAQKSAIDNAVEIQQYNIQLKLREQNRLYEIRRQEQLREEKKWQAEQRRERERRRKAAIEEANYQKYIKEQKERERIAKIEEEKRFNNWIRNEKEKLDNQLTNWNNDVLVFIHSIDKSYSIGRAENSKDYFDKLTTTLDNIIIAPNISVLDKSIFIDDIINKTKGYQNIYSKYNYRNIIPEEIKNNLGKVYAYAKAHYGYHPAVQYEQTFTQKKERNKNLVRINDDIKRKTLVKNAFKEGEVKIGIFEYISKIVNDETYYGYIDNYKPQNIGSFSDDLNFGYLFYYNGDLDHAKAYLKKGLEYFEKNKIYSPEYFQAYSHLISVYTKKNYPKEFIVDIEIFEKRLKKAYDTNKLDKVYLSKNTNMIYVDENLQQSYFRVLAHGYQRLESWNSMVKSKFKINNNNLIKEAKDMIKKSDNLYELGNAIEDLVSTLKYRDEKFYKKNLTDFKFKQNISANMKSEDLLTIIRDSYDAKDFELTEKTGKQFLLYDSNTPSIYPNEINKVLKSAIYNGNFESGLTFAYYSLFRKKNQTRESSIRDTSDEKYALLLINLIMLNKTQHFYLIFDQDYKEVEKGTQITFYIQNDLTAFASSQKDGVYGYEILEDIVKKFSEKKINSPAILYIYNAINDAKTKI